MLVYQRVSRKPCVFLAIPSAVHAGFLQPIFEITHPGCSHYFHGCRRANCLVAHPTARKWVITPVINGISRVNPLITGVITHLLSGMSHQLSIFLESHVTRACCLPTFLAVKAQIGLVHVDIWAWTRFGYPKNWCSIPKMANIYQNNYVVLWVFDFNSRPHGLRHYCPKFEWLNILHEPE